VGDEVFGLAYGGAYAEYIAVSVKMIVHKPKELSWETAAGLPEVWFTAIQALFLVANIQKGQTVLFHAGASSTTPCFLGNGIGVSQCLIQLAKAEGAKTILATAGTDEKTQLCEKLGATKGINYKKTDWAEEVKKVAPEGVDITVDYILGQGYLQKDLDVAARDGTIVLLAALGGRVLKDFDAGPILFKRLAVPPLSGF
jgi:NADPH:quinone reductase-like Zn-dependent oxidoreductase